MSENQKKKQRTEADAELEREIRNERKFTLEEAIGRLIGPGGMKGVSPISRLQQAGCELQNYLHSHLTDAAGAIETVILRHVTGSELLLHNPEQPLVVLASYCQRMLNSDYYLRELVRAADVEWGKLMQEQPYFEKEGSPPHPDDPYTVVRVRHMLSELLQQLTVDAVPRDSQGMSFTA